MTKKHFNAIAAALASTKPATKRGNAYKTWANTVRNVASTCSRFNYNFDRNRFLTACGLEDK